MNSRMEMNADADAHRPSLSRQRNWIGLICLLLAMAIGWAFQNMRNNRSRLDAALASESHSHRLASEIQQLRDRPRFAALNIDSLLTITERAEQASGDADMDPVSLVRIEPDRQAVRLGDSPYQTLSTRLKIRNVTLQQVIKFTHAMIDESQGTTVRDLRLESVTSSNIETAREGFRGAAADLWTAELVLTQLIFAPPVR